MDNTIPHFIQLTVWKINLVIYINKKLNCSDFAAISSTILNDLYFALYNHQILLICAVPMLL